MAGDNKKITQLTDASTTTVVADLVPIVTHTLTTPVTEYTTISGLLNTAYIHTVSGCTGIGVDHHSPQYVLDVYKAGTSNYGQIVSRNYTSSPIPGIRGLAATGTINTPGAAPSGCYLMFFAGHGYTGTGFTAAANALIGLLAAETFSTTENGTYITFGTTPIGSTTRATRMVINPAGNVGIGHAVWTTLNDNAILDITSTTKAVLTPRMTTTQRDNIPNPTEGMLIFNLTTHVFNFYNGSTWGAI